MSQDIVILPVEGLGRVASPAAVETALVRLPGVRAVSMNVTAGRIRIVFRSEATGLRDFAAVIGAVGCGLRVTQTMLRARGGDYPWCNAIPRARTGSVEGADCVSRSCAGRGGSR